MISSSKYAGRDYWNKTETYEALTLYIRKDFDGLKDAVALLMDGGRLAIDTSTYQNDMTTFTCRDDVLSLLIHLGYLGFVANGRTPINHLRILSHCWMLPGNAMKMQLLNL